MARHNKIITSLSIEKQIAKNDDSRLISLHCQITDVFTEVHILPFFMSSYGVITFQRPKHPLQVLLRPSVPLAVRFCWAQVILDIVNDRVSPRFFFFIFSPYI